VAHTDEPTNKPASAFGGVGALLTSAGLGYLIANDFDTGTALTVVGLICVTIALGTLAWPAHPGLGAKPAAGAGGH
jgi:hypothetical protein